jgi:hypothetical protein
MCITHSLVRHVTRTPPRDVEAIRAKASDDERRNFRVGLDAGRNSFHNATALRRETAKVLSSDQALGRAMQTHEKDSRA